MVANRVANIDEALACYEQILSTRRVPAKRLKMGRAPSTQNQAFSALLYAYAKVYEKELGDLSGGN